MRREWQSSTTAETTPSSASLSLPPVCQWWRHLELNPKSSYASAKRVSPVQMWIRNWRSRENWTALIKWRQIWSTHNVADSSHLVSWTYGTRMFKINGIHIFHFWFDFFKDSVKPLWNVNKAFNAYLEGRTDILYALTASIFFFQSQIAVHLKPFFFNPKFPWFSQDKARNVKSSQILC